MTDDLEPYTPRQRNPMKFLSLLLGIVALIVTLGAGMNKAYYVTPMKLEDHDAKLKRLEEVDAATARELREQRDLLLEIRGDIKVLNRATRNNQP